MPPLPYTQLAVGGAAVLLLAALCWAFYRWGRSAEHAKALKIILDAERKMQGAVEKARADPLRVDRSWVRRGSGSTPEPPSVPPAPPTR